MIRLIRDPVVVKIARRGTRPSEVARTVQFVRWLMEQDFPTVPLYPVSDQPVVVDGHAVTFWTFLPQPDHPVSAAQIAAPLHALHSLPTPPFPIRRVDNVAVIRRSLAATQSLPSHALRYLANRLDRLEAALATVRFNLPEGILQGDPQHRNALHLGDRAVLCDWDTFVWGHPEWDLVTIEIHCRRFGYGRQHYQAFSDAYGYDVTAWDGYPVLRDLREIRMIATNARKVIHAPQTAPEVTRRIEGLASENTALEWQIL
ncbi:aminoglycoside phosphotransferase family protein [Actinoallomurus purpureus]|nr:aminoglycoside phosphotransferase family protein [Actinoallomurus purpureus]MCO6006252.1 aminoglycoside phosphotransferase family protein [Actinoallomurus purpureus]